MGSFKSTILTQKAHALMAKLTVGTAESTFTKIKSSDHDYSSLTSSQLESLTTLEDIKQEVSVSEIKIINDASVKVTATLVNTELTEGYYIKAIGLYATDPDEGEILYSITVAIESDWMPPYNNISSASALYDLVTTVSNSENVSINVDPNAVVNITQFNNFKEQVNSQLSENTQEIKKVESLGFKDLIMSTLFETNGNANHIYISNDAVNFKRIDSEGIFNGRDTSFCYYDGHFYFLNTGYNPHDFVVKKSSDLINFEEFNISVGILNSNTERTKIWAGEWFFLDDKSGYIFITVRNGMDGTADRFEIWRVAFNLETFAFSNAIALDLESADTNCNKIDPFIILKDSTYYMFVKDDHEGQYNIEEWTSSDLLNWTKISDNINVFNSWKVEGPSVVFKDGKYYLYVDVYEYGGVQYMSESDDLINWTQAIPAQIEGDCRHGSYKVIEDPKAKNIIKNFRVSNINKEEVRQYKLINYALNNVIETFCPIQNGVYVTDIVNSTLTINNIKDGVDKFFILLTSTNYGDGSVKIKASSNINIENDIVISTNQNNNCKAIEFRWIKYLNKYSVIGDYNKTSARGYKLLAGLAVNNIISLLQPINESVYWYNGVDTTIEIQNIAPGVDRFYLCNVATTGIGGIKILSTASNLFLTQDILLSASKQNQGQLLEFIWVEGLQKYMIICGIGTNYSV